MNYIERAGEVIGLEIQGLQKIRNELDNGFNSAIRLMLKTLESKGKVVVTGIGKNLHIAEKISATFSSTGSTSVVLNPVQAIHGDLGILTTDDVVLTLSYSGESEELLAILPLIKRLGIKIIALTGDSSSTLARNSDAVISVAIASEACPFNMAPTTSTTATLAMGDALAMVLLDARGFKKEDYAKLHPGGAIGRALLLKASDIMRPLDRIAVVSQNDKVKDALVAMTKFRAGSACVVNDAGSVTGIFTDGDLRRHISDKPDILNMNIRSVMTPSPITVSPDQLAADVLAVFERHKIDDLLVVDKNNKPIGSVDIQDLPKLKIL